MGFVVNVIFIIGAIALLAVSGGYSTDAARRVTDITGWSDNPELKSAHSLLSGAAVATWIGLALIIVLLILYFIYFFETIEITGGFVTYLFLFVLLALVILIGVLSAIAANKINSANVSDNKGSYKQAIIAASLALGVMGIVIILMILKFYLQHHKSKVEAEKAVPVQHVVQTEEREAEEPSYAMDSSLLSGERLSKYSDMASRYKKLAGYE